MKKLTPKQKAFVEAYSGNATEATRLAGYAHNSAEAAGARLLRNVKVRAAIEEREKVESRARIASRQERQEFWTDVMKSDEADMKDRLRASELLGKSEGDFLEKIDHTSSDGTMSPVAPIDLGGLSSEKLTELAKIVFKKAD